MGYFDKEESKQAEMVYKSGSEELLKELADICLEQLMLNSDAYICSIETNMQGYKRLHRYLSKKFHDLYLKIQKEAVERYGRVIPSDIEFSVYKPKNMKNHLNQWNSKIEEHLKHVGLIIKGIFEADGYICCTAQEIQKCLFKHYIKNERAIHKFEDCDWSYEVIYEHDEKLHRKMKDKEHDSYK